MSREEIIRIFRSETIGATPSGMTAGELATNLADRKLFIGGSQGDNIAFMAISSITGTATIVAKGTILGEEWSDTTFDTNTWTDVTPSSNTWTTVTGDNNTWLQQG